MVGYAIQSWPAKILIRWLSLGSLSSRRRNYTGLLRAISLYSSSKIMRLGSV